MEFPRIVLGVNVKDFQKTVALAVRVRSSLTGNASYTPEPALTVLDDLIVQVTQAIALWGPKGNRGSHAAYLDLSTKNSTLVLTLKQLAQSCSNQAEQAAGLDYNSMRAILSTSGFEISKIKEAQPRLQPVRVFRTLKSLNLDRNQVKLKWQRPVNTTTSKDVSIYQVYSNTTPDFATATIMANSTKTSFIYTNDGPMVTLYFWIVAVNSQGPGSVSDMLTVTLLGA